MITPAKTIDSAGEAIVDIVGGAHVSATPEALAQIGVVTDPGDQPAWLVRPGSAAEIAELLRLCQSLRIAAIPVGNASRAPRTAPLRDRARVFVDCRRMDHVLFLDETSLVVQVQAGLSGLALERILAPRGLSLGDFPPAALGSTIGGLLSVRTPGKSSPRHGFLEDAVIALSAVLADGKTIHTRVAPRRSAGPDLCRALCGSEGTLGFITAAVLRIHRRPEARFLAAHAVPSFEAGLAAVHLALREEAAPAAMRIYDPEEARAHLGEDVGAGPDEAVLVAATAGPTDLAACDRDLVASATAAVGGRPLAEDVAKLWWRRRTGRGDVPAVLLPTMQVSAAQSRQLAVYRAVLGAAEARGTRARAHASRFDAHGGVLFFTLFHPGTGEALSAAEAAAARRTCEAAAAEAGADVLGQKSAALDDYFEKLRTRLDPNRIMNPGVLV